VKPLGRSDDDVLSFLDQNQAWILDQIKRVRRLQAIRVVAQPVGELLFRGEPRRVRVKQTNARHRGNFVSLIDGEIVVAVGRGSQTTIARSLENWLRRQARKEIEKYLFDVTTRLRREPHRVYVMEQRTKWGNCSSAQNLSFNWRVILAPDFVLRYLVTHEAVHLAIPDHSAKFWLTVQSLCRETERAKQWLSANGGKLAIELNDVC
jgi:hypothetical protein